MPSNSLWPVFAAVIALGATYGAFNTANYGVPASRNAADTLLYAAFALAASPQFFALVFLPFALGLAIYFRSHVELPEVVMRHGSVPLAVIASTSRQARQLFVALTLALVAAALTSLIQNSLFTIPIDALAANFLSAGSPPLQLALQFWLNMLFLLLSNLLITLSVAVSGQSARLASATIAALVWLWVISSTYGLIPATSPLNTSLALSGDQWSDGQSGGWGVWSTLSIAALLAIARMPSPHWRWVRGRAFQLGAMTGGIAASAVSLLAFPALQLGYPAVMEYVLVGGESLATSIEVFTFTGVSLLGYFRLFPPANDALAVAVALRHSGWASLARGAASSILQYSFTFMLCASSVLFLVTTFVGSNAGVNKPPQVPSLLSNWLLIGCFTLMTGFALLWVVDRLFDANRAVLFGLATAFCAAASASPSVFGVHLVPFFSRAVRVADFTTSITYLIAVVVPALALFWLFLVHKRRLEFSVSRSNRMA